LHQLSMTLFVSLCLLTYCHVGYDVTEYVTSFFGPTKDDVMARRMNAA